jgi:hypothetical protein
MYCLFSDVHGKTDMSPKFISVMIRFKYIHIANHHQWKLKSALAILN